MKTNFVFLLALALSLTTSFIAGYRSGRNNEQQVAFLRFKEVCRKTSEPAFLLAAKEVNFATKREALAEASMLLGAGQVYPAAYLTSKWCADFDYAEFGELEDTNTTAFIYGYVYRCIVRNFKDL